VLRQQHLDLGFAPVGGRRHQLVHVLGGEMGRQQAERGQMEPPLGHRLEQRRERRAARAAWIRL
jgi:hypothetical protein